MKTLELNQMAFTKAGGGNWGDWVCAGVGVGGVIALALKVTIGPIGVAVGVGCALYGLGRVADWW